MLEANIKSARLDGLFDDVISSDEIQTYKPDARAYRLGLNTMKVQRQEALFVAFAGWEAAGAKSFGYRTFWANRLKTPTERLGVEPDFIGNDLTGLAHYATSL